MPGRRAMNSLPSQILNVVGKQSMTHQEFQQKIKKKNWFDRYWYLGLCYLTIALSLVLFFLIVTNPNKFKGNHIFHYSVFSFLFLMGAYGLYKLPNRFKLVSIDTLKNLTDKKAILSNVIIHLGSTPVMFNDNYYLIRYQKNFWLSSFDIHLFYDDKVICFSVQGHGSSDGGFIDFGGTERLRRRIKDEIELQLS